MACSQRRVLYANTLKSRSAPCRVSRSSEPRAVSSRGLSLLHHRKQRGSTAYTYVLSVNIRKMRTGNKLYSIVEFTMLRELVGDSSFPVCARRCTYDTRKYIGAKKNQELKRNGDVFISILTSCPGCVIRQIWIDNDETP